MLTLTLTPLVVLLSLSLSSFSVCELLQYNTDDVDYTPFYDYSDGATDTVPTDEHYEPQVIEKRERGKKGGGACYLLCVFVLHRLCVSVSFIVTPVTVSQCSIGCACKQSYSLCLLF